MEKVINNKSLDLNSKNKSCGTIEACKKCSGLTCCGIVSEGGVIEPPYLTKHDIGQIEQFTGLKKDEFTVERKNPVTGNAVFFMKTIVNEGCVFFNRNKGKCEIYSFRPIDCRLFPIDCKVFPSNVNNYYWALYKFKRCNLSKKDISSLLEYREEATCILGKEIHDFATYPLPEMEKIGFKKLSKFNLCQGENECIDNQKS
jgi:Fe-S-cluster containining protein